LKIIIIGRISALKRTSLILVFSLLLCGAVPAEENKKSMRIGLWAPCEGENHTFSTAQKIREMLDFSKSLSATDVFIQVYRRNEAWFPSQIAGTTMYQSLQTQEKIDPLQTVIQEAKKRNIKVHAWINVLWIGKEKNTTVIKKLGKDVITRDQKNRSLFDYPNNLIPGMEGKWYSYGEDGFWLDPGDPKVQKYLTDLVAEIISKYPDLDGIHLDFVRFPFTTPFLPGSYYSFNRGIEFGYGTESVKRFRSSSGLNPLSMERTVLNHLKWDQWRRDQISDLVQKIRQQVHLGKNRELSAAILPWPERSYFSAYQDWGRWLDEGLVDFGVSMNYTLDLRLGDNLSKMAMSVEGKADAWIGLGPYLFESDAASFKKQLESTCALKPKGIVFFSYDGLLKQKEVTDAIRAVVKGKKS
jgi:uncharacterized lipoprotein YddW (UPF0748 family)